MDPRVRLQRRNVCTFASAFRSAYPFTNGQQCTIAFALFVAHALPHAFANAVADSGAFNGANIGRPAVQLQFRTGRWQRSSVGERFVLFLGAKLNLSICAAARLDTYG